MVKLEHLRDGKKNITSEDVMSVAYEEETADGTTGDFFKEWNDITPQTHIRKFGDSFLTSIGSSGLVRTLWMSEMTPIKAPVLKPVVFWCECGE